MEIQFDEGIDHASSIQRVFITIQGKANATLHSLSTLAVLNIPANKTLNVQLRDAVPRRVHTAAVLLYLNCFLLCVVLCYLCIFTTVQYHVVEHFMNLITVQ